MNDGTEVDTFLNGLPSGQREKLERVRRTIREAVPSAIESISYGIPAYKYRGKPLIYFGPAKKHWALYGAGGDAYPELSEHYDTSKGTIRFPWDEPVPVDVVRMVVADRRAKIEADAREVRKSDPTKD